MLMNKKRTLSIIMIAIMIFGMLTTVHATPSSWAEEFIKSMLLEGLSSDELLDSDYLQQPITREEFAELTVRLYAKANNMKVEDVVEWNPFADTDNVMVAKAYNIGIVSGTGVDSKNRKLFTPSKYVTRQEIAVMLIKELRVLGQNTDAKYDQKFSDDTDIASWSYDAVAFASESGILSGVGDNRVAPLQNATREQAMVLINKIAVKYGWIDNNLIKSKFTYGNATKSNGFWVPNYNATPLRASTNNSGVRYVISYLVDSYTPNIELQQNDLINILVTADPVSYNALVTTRNLILSSYDPISKKYITSDTVYINLTTGQSTTYAIAKPYITFKVDTEITLEYIK